MSRRTVPAEVRDRQRQAVELRLAGADYGQIAAALGYAHHSGARQAVQRGLDLAIIEPGEEVLRQELARLDRMLAGLWKRAVTGDHQAVDRALKTMDRRARYLGLDAPTKVAATSELDEEITALVDQLGGADDPARTGP